MAEIQVSQKSGKRRNYATPKIDLTPMVDLGFILITFFMYTTTLARPSVMELHAPPKGPQLNPPQIPGEATIVVIPTRDHRVAWYSGLDNPAEGLQWFSKDGNESLRSVLMRKSAELKALPASYSIEAHKLHVLIKPDTATAYADVVNVLDELLIADIPAYTLMSLESNEKDALKKSFATAYGK
jgi:biopolymer transport protein ExbD